MSDSSENARTSGGKPFDSWKEIAAYFQSDVRIYFNLRRAYTLMQMDRPAIAGLKKACELSEESPAMMMQLGYA